MKKFYPVKAPSLKPTAVTKSGVNITGYLRLLQELGWNASLDMSIDWSTTSPVHPVSHSYSMKVVRPKDGQTHELDSLDLDNLFAHVLSWVLDE